MLDYNDRQGKSRHRDINDRELRLREEVVLVHEIGWLIQTNATVHPSRPPSTSLLVRAPTRA